MTKVLVALMAKYCRRPTEYYIPKRGSRFYEHREPVWYPDKKLVWIGNHSRVAYADHQTAAEAAAEEEAKKRRKEEKRKKEERKKRR